jgi:hypothetical protein
MARMLGNAFGDGRLDGDGNLMELEVNLRLLRFWIGQAVDSDGISSILIFQDISRSHFPHFAVPGEHQYRSVRSILRRHVDHFRLDPDSSSLRKRCS